MSAYNVREVARALKRKGFEPDHGDHEYLRLVVDGRKTPIRTHVSHGKGFDVGPNLLAQMARQARLSNSEFRDLVDCPLSHEEYVRILKRDGWL